MAKAEQESISIPDQSHQGLINDLMYIGFTQNEARTFMALISYESASASTLVKKTGIRDSKIYQVLDRLEKKGFVTVQEGTPKKYMVIYPNTPLESIRLKLKEEYKKKATVIDRLATILPPMYHEHEDSPKLAYIIKGKGNVLNHVKRLMEEATSSVILMMPNSKIFSLLTNSISKLQSKKIDVKIGIFGKITPENKFSMKVQMISCECFFLIIDNKVLLTVSRWNTDHWHGIWTTETSLIEVSSGYFSSPCCTYEHSNCSC
jgi:sugar-specific transcriptional regulator TrmB